MGLVVNFPVKFEDRFNMALKLQPKFKVVADIEPDNNDENTYGCNYYFKLTHDEYNKFFEWLKDVQVIMDIPFKFRYTYNQKEAYTGYSNNSMYKHSWLKFN